MAQEKNTTPLGLLEGDKTFEESMKMIRNLTLLACAFSCIMATGCKKRNGSVWDDQSTAGNYKGNARSLWGNDDLAQDEVFFEPSEEDFISLKDDDLHAQFSDGALPQPKTSPGEKGSIIPGIEGFHSPIGAESAIFKTIYFNTDDHIIREKESLAIVERIASYLKSHPNVYVFISGNCDERGPEAYNLSLGARRANYVRTLLAQKGIDSERLHTISYGKERPVDPRHSQEGWAKNRRTEFKIYQKSSN